MNRPSFVAKVRTGLRPVVLWFTRSSHRELLTASLRPRIEVLQGGVLDIGGGRHSPLAEYWPSTATRIRLDISPRFAPQILGDAQRLPVASSSLDGVVLSEVLEHLPQPVDAIAEIHRVLRPGGVLIGSVPFAIGIHADPHDYFRYTHESLELLLGEFEDVDVRPHGNHVGAAWRALNSRWHWLWIANPAIRPFGRRTDRRWPVGYTFTARNGAVAAEDGAAR